MTGVVGRRAVGAWLGGVALLLVLPSTEYAVFDGLPASTPAEFLAVAALLPFLVSSELRARVGALLTRRPPALRRLVLLAPVALVAIKLALLAGAPTTGFAGCYRPLDSRPPVGACEGSYENLTRRADAATRIDSRIDFGPWSADVSKDIAGTDWNLSWLNDERFNDFRLPNALRYRLRQPFEARWRGDVEIGSGESARVTYVGDGRLWLGARATPLPPAYARPRTVLAQAPPGRHALRVVYRFAEPPTVRMSPAGRPYAQIRVDRVTSGGAEPLQAASPPVLVVLGARATDVGVTALVLLLALTIAIALGGAWSILAATAATALILQALPLGFLSRESVRTAVASVLLLGLIAWRRPKHPLLLGYLALLVVSAARVLPLLHSWGSVLYRTPGDDWLTYESQARAILDHHSLEGGEAVFHYQAAFRYVVFLEHAIWGDGDAAHAIMGLTALGVGALALVMAAGFAPTRARLRLQLGVAAAVLGLLASDPVRGAVLTGLSEYPTWILLPLVISLAVTAPRRWRPWILAAAGVGSMFILRANQALGGAILLAALICAARRPRVRVGAAMLAVAVGIAALIPIHNLAYGGRLVVAPTSGSEANNTVIPVGDLPRAVTDSAIRSKLWHQVTALLYLPPGAPFQRGIAPFYWAVLAGWLATIGWVLLRRVRLTPTGYLLLALPVGYLLPHLSYAIVSYYPRHITISYLAMGYATIAILGPRLHRDPPARE
ncbi:MAG: hypothetical protein QOK25_179 [Thermoleophilaceae bacterium]|nr:hypothetical protein [Thermoleophilaceae bacterium]